MKPVLGVILAGVATFMFGFVYWMVLDMPGKALLSFTDDVAVQSALSELLPESGTYFYPDNDLYESDPDAYNAAYEAGPRAMIHIRKGGGKAMGPIHMAIGFLYNVATWALVALLLKLVVPALQSYASRVLAVALTGLAVAFYINVGALIWFPVEPTWAMVNGVDQVLSWLIAGLVLAAFIKPQSS